MYGLCLILLRQSVVRIGSFLTKGSLSIMVSVVPSFHPTFYSLPPLYSLFSLSNPTLYCLTQLRSLFSLSILLSIPSLNSTRSSLFPSYSLFLTQLHWLFSLSILLSISPFNSTRFFLPPAFALYQWAVPSCLISYSLLLMS